jgi:hypothetical protein
MGALLLAALVAGGPAPVALLPPDAADLRREAVRAAAEALAQALPAPFRAADGDPAAVREHLAARGPGCRADLSCLCAAAALSPGQLALDLAVAPLGADAWAADLRLAAPCDGRALARRAEVVAARPAELRRFLAHAVPELLRGRDLPQPPARSAGPSAPEPGAAGGVVTPRPPRGRRRHRSWPRRPRDRDRARRARSRTGGSSA